MYVGVEMGEKIENIVRKGCVSSQTYITFITSHILQDINLMHLTHTKYLQYQR